MKQSLSRKQLVIALITLMGVVTFLVLRYFQAPAFSPDSQTHGTFYTVTVADIKVDLRGEFPCLAYELRPSPAPTPPEHAIQAVIDPFFLNADAVSARSAQLKEKAIAYLRQAGVPLSLEPAHPLTPDDRPLYLTVQISGDGKVDTRKPHSGVLISHLRMDREFYVDVQRTQVLRVGLLPRLAPISDCATPISPTDSLEKKQAELLGRTLEAFVTAWKEENPTTSQ